MRKIRLISLLSCWLEQRKVGVQIFDDLQIAAFLKAQRKLLRRHHQVQHTLGQLLQHLRRSKIIPNPPPTQAGNPSEQLIHDYRRFLTEERGLSQTTLANYIPVAESFLSYVLRAKAIHLRELTAADINGFILRERLTFSPKRVQLTTSALRGFLGFLYLATPLAAVVPTVATWRFSEMPKFIEPEQVQQMLRSCDQGNACGRRDYAVLLFLARLGLRAGEVVHLCLEDIDWNAGTVLVRGKSARQDHLPLPSEVGCALAAYLQKGRPFCDTRRVFVRMKAPHVGFSSAVAICDIVRRALLRAGLQPERKGSHLLRHSTAMDLVQHGVDRSVIALWLGHESMDTTQVYLHASLALKEQALAKTDPLKGQLGRYRPSDKLLAFLQTL